MKVVAKWLGQVLAWLVILSVVVVLAVAVVIPRLGGATPYTILTGSMKPGLPPGTLVVVRPVPIEDIRVGDVVTYQLESGKSPVVTHRVVEVRQQLDGDTVLITRGDANEAVDRDPILPVQVRGRLWYSVPYVGRISNVLNDAQRQAAVYVVAGGLFLYAAWMFGSALLGRSRPSTGREP